ncbi:MAG: hypothetical protein ACK41Y_14455 [Paracoccus hibiscisoli]|uniref:hypothetical protein n=1 Tax=Paracoccus hibiscisoli TaxID=2023261 RepID=UPI00391A07A0
MTSSYNPFTGTFERGDLHTGASAIADPGTPIAAQTTDRSLQERHGEGKWTSTSDLARGEGIERTVRNANGFPVLDRPYQAQDRVNIPGMNGVTLAQAAQLGFAKMNQDGSFSFSGEAGSDRAAAPSNNPQGNPQGQPSGDTEGAPSDAETFRISDSGEEAMTALVGSLPQSTQMAAINAVVETGNISPEMIDRMAQRSGQDPEELTRQVLAVHEGFYDAVMDRVGALGVHDDELFGDFINTDSRMARQMQQAVRDMVMNNDPTGFDSLAQKFTAELDLIDPESVTAALKGAGIQHRKSGSGEILLTMQGHPEVSYREAVKLGLIKVSRA